MTIPERFLGRMQELKSAYAAEALDPSKKDQTEFGYGKACGIYQGFLIVEQAFNQISEEIEKEQRG